MKVVYTPPPPPKSLKPPSWWQTFFKPTGTVVKHNGVYWRIAENWSWGDYDGRSWERVTPEVVLELKAQGKIDE